VNEDEKGILDAAPRIKAPKVDNAREGFFEDDDFAALLREGEFVFQRTGEHRLHTLAA
jgi:hypothetical protein